MVGVAEVVTGHVALRLRHLQQRAVLESLRSALDLHRNTLGLRSSTLGLRSSPLGLMLQEARPRLGRPRHALKECSALRLLLHCALLRHGLSALALGLVGQRRRLVGCRGLTRGTPAASHGAPG